MDVMGEPISQILDRRPVQPLLLWTHDVSSKARTARPMTRSPSLYCEHFDGTLDDWGKVLAGFPDREIFQTPAWIRFVAETQGARPVILAIKEGAKTVGYFAGLIVPKAGLNILGSPFTGWTTRRMGIRLLPDVSKRAAVEAVTDYAFHHLKCVHLEIDDLNISRDDVAGLGFHHAVWYDYIVDLTLDTDVIYSRMSSKSCRYCIRRAEKLGVIIEEASDEAFADDYHMQLCDVFAKQSLVPTYDKERVQTLIRHLLPTGNLLLLRAREPQGRCIATSIFLGMNLFAYFWGNASWRQDQRFCPNEALQWYAMQYWKQRGMRYYVLGSGIYKRKYGGEPVESDHLWRSKYCWISWARRAAQFGYRAGQHVAGLWQKRKSHSASNEET